MLTPVYIYPKALEFVLGFFTLLLFVNTLDDCLQKGSGSLWIQDGCTQGYVI